MFYNVEMMRRIQQKDIQEKKQTEKKAIKALADSEFREEEVDPAELERIRRRQAGTAVTVEAFNKWKASFDVEMARKELDAIKAAGGTAGFNVLSPLAAIVVGSGTAKEGGAGAADAESNKALMEMMLSGDGRPTGKQYFLLNLNSKGGANKGDVEADEEAEGEIELGVDEEAGLYGDDDEEEDDEDYVPGEDNDDDDDDDDDEDYEEGD
jgi:hypothetical protein